LVTPNTSLAPHSINQAASTVPSGVSCLASFYVKPNGYTKCAIAENQITGFYVSFDLSGAGSVLSQSSAVGTVTALDDGWYRITHTSVSGGTSFRPQFFFLPQTYTSGSIIGSWTPNGTSGIYLWGADLRVANDTALPVYQRVDTSTSYDTTGFPMYLRFDGSDDSMISSTITPGIDKAQCFVGLRRNAITSSYQTVYEYSVNPDANNGVFGLTGENISAGGRLYTSSQGTTYAFAIPSAGTLNTLTTNVLSHLMDISAPSVSLRADGVSVGASTSTQGTGNFGNYPLYIGRRGGTTTPFSGRLYSIILRFGVNLTETQIGQTETWVNGKTKAY
jgi:hypothetical protein